MKRLGFATTYAAIFALLTFSLAAGGRFRLSEAEVPAMVAQVRSDFRLLAQALEAYRADQGGYPMDVQYYQFSAGQASVSQPLFRLTTPTSYLAVLPLNPFVQAQGPYAGNPNDYQYKADRSWIGLVSAFTVEHPLGSWVVTSCGPDLAPNYGEYAVFGEEILNSKEANYLNGFGPGCLYDPTNGTISAGDLAQFGPFLRSAAWESYR